MDVSDFINSLHDYVEPIKGNNIKIIGNKVDETFDYYIKKTTEFKGRINIDTFKPLEETFNNMLVDYLRDVFPRMMSHGGCVSID